MTATNVRTLQDQIDEDLADERLLASLTSGFRFLAPVLANVELEPHGLDLLRTESEKLPDGTSTRFMAP